MKKRELISLAVLCSIAFTVLIVAGCAHPKPEFDQTYLPNTVPGAPGKRIDLTRAVAEKVTVRTLGMFGENARVSLYWEKPDALLFNIFSENRKKLLSSFRIVPGTGQIKLLEPAERDAFLSRMEKSASLVDTETLAGSLGKGAVQVLSIIVSLGRSMADFPDHYVGKLENNGFAVDFDVVSNTKGGGWFRSVYYDCKYAAKSNQTGSVFSREMRIEYEDRIKLEGLLQEWLQSWRITPDGKYYLIGKTAAFIDPEYGDYDTFIWNYSYTALDVSPNWDQIAVLMIKEDEKTGKMRYWIEFYPFSYKNKETNINAKDKPE